MAQILCFKIVVSGHLFLTKCIRLMRFLEIKDRHETTRKAIPEIECNRDTKNLYCPISKM